MIGEVGFRAEEELDCEGAVKGMPSDNVINVPLACEVWVDVIVCYWREVIILHVALLCSYSQGVRPRRGYGLRLSGIISEGGV